MRWYWRKERILIIIANCYKRLSGRSNNHDLAYNASFGETDVSLGDFYSKPKSTWNAFSIIEVVQKFPCWRHSVYFGLGDRFPFIYLVCPCPLLGSIRLVKSLSGADLDSVMNRRRQGQAIGGEFSEGGASWWPSLLHKGRFHAKTASNEFGTLSRCLITIPSHL